MQFITVQHFLYKANINVTVSNKDINYWRCFNYNDGMTKGESLELERTVSISTILCDGLLYKVWSQAFICPVYTQPSMFILLGRIFYPTVSSVSLCSFLHILTPTMLSTISTPPPTPSHFSLHLRLLSAPIYSFRPKEVSRELATSFLMSDLP